MTPFVLDLGNTTIGERWSSTWRDGAGGDGFEELEVLEKCVSRFQ
jgi:hypothetical protein